MADVTPAFSFAPRLLHGLAVAVLLVVTLDVAAAGGATLEEVRDVAAAGAPGLALDLVDGAQPRQDDQPQEWLRWERERLAILASQGWWPRLVTRVDAYPPDLPAEFLGRARLLGIEARLELGQAAASRRALRRLLWTPAGDDIPPQRLRRLVIESHLVEGGADEAFTAMLRYRLDYGQGDADWQRQLARVMLLAGHPADALEALSGLEDPEAVFLRLMARLRAGDLDWQQGQEAVVELAAAQKLSALQHYQLAVALAERAATPAQRVIALERAMAQRRRAAGTALVTVDPGELWAAYTTHARLLANARQLLIGQFDHWLELAASLADGDPAASRSLYAYVAEEAADPVWRRAAQEALVAALRALPEGLEILRQLYLESGRFADTTALPEVVRYGLVDQALDAGDIPLASELASGLEEPPVQGNDFDWQLRRARVLVLGGRHGEGAAVLERLVTGHPVLAAGDVDRLNQVLFELQKVGEPVLAYRLFELVLERVEEPGLQREILYWMADSLKAAGRPLEAARLYLRSAMLPGPGVMDPWSQTARYHAAEALAEAGLAADARNLYTTLLAVAKEPERQAVLRRAIAQLTPGGGDAAR